LWRKPAQVRALHELPVLFVVMNNAKWGAVERSTRAMYGDGHAMRSNAPAFVALDKLPAFEKVCEAAGGYGERVDDPAALPGALQRALAVVANEKRQALLNLICGPGGSTLLPFGEGCTSGEVIDSAPA
jgi:acetolactate synthase I/II/III large subunit